MSDSTLSLVVRQLRELAEPVSAASDGELLDRFARLHDAAALDALVRRHGPTVLGVCRRLLRGPADVDDVFQATFLVFVRRARTLSPRGSLAAWLHTVATHLALRTRAAARRTPPEAAQRPPPEPPTEAAARELCALLDEEPARLPEKYRAPLLLCCLEGRSRDEAARQLGYGVGALKGRLERGRALLRRRLEARGVTLSGALLAGLLVRDARADVPVTLAHSTAQAALDYLGGTASTTAASLAGGFLKGMALGRFKVMAALALLVGVVALGAALFVAPAPAAPVQEQPARQGPAGPPAPAQAKAPAPGDAEPLPAGAVARFGSRLFREGEEIQAIAWSPDGKAIACANLQKLDVRLWDPTTGKVLRVLKGHQGGVWCLAYSTEGKTLVTGSPDGTLRLWDTATGRERLCIPTRQGVPSALALSPDGKTVASAAHNKTLCLWSTAGGQQLHNLQGHKGILITLAFAPDGKTLAGGGGEDRVCLWDVASGRELPKLDLPAGGTSCVRFSPDGKTLAVSGLDGSINLWNLAAGQSLTLGKAERAFTFPQPIAFSPDGKLLACGSMGMVQLWDPAAGKLLSRLAPGQHSRSLAFSPDGKTLATGSEGSIRLWDVATGKERFPDEGHHGSVKAIAFSPDGKLLASGSKDWTVRLWDVKTGKERACLRGHTDVVNSVAFSPDGKLVASGGSYTDRTVRLWDVATGKEARNVATLPHRVSAVAFSPDGALLFASCYQEVRAWNVATGAQVRVFKGGDFTQSTLAVSPDGRLVATGSEGWDVRVWNVRSGGQLHAIRVPNGDIRRVAFTPDGKTLAVCSAAPPCRFYDLATGREVSPAPQNGYGWVFALSPDGQLAASGDNFGKLHLWEFATGQDLVLAAPHGLTAEFSPDGGTLATGNYDCSVLLWDVRAVVQGKHAAVKLSAKELDRLWDELSSADARKAWQAVGRLAASPEQAVALVRERMGPGAGVPPELHKRVLTLVGELSDTKFAVREKAFAELGRLGRAAESSLRAALAGELSAEARRRIEQLLAKLQPGGRPSWYLPAARSLALLEQIGTAEARATLQLLAARAGHAPLRLNARAALERLAR
ncbi:MAG: sigma-70 family RNA polymerase sigma factor [Gemmataceae bacterium]|nr:sigma-70 family RNA polymerase sigma factor [Gemmataceae bacterium]